MSGIYKEDLALATTRLFELGEQGAGVEYELELGVGLSGNGASLTNFHPQAFHEAARLTFAKADPGERFNAGDSLFGIGYRSGAKRASQTLQKGLQ